MILSRLCHREHTIIDIIVVNCKKSRMILLYCIIHNEL